MSNSDMTCTLCSKRDISNAAIVLCAVCEERFCLSCNEVHKYLKTSSSHEVTALDVYTHLPTFISSLKQTCDSHEEHFKLYCPTHREPCCYKCTTTKHKTCHGFQTLDSLIEHSATQFLDLECTIDELSINIEKVFNNRKGALKTLDDKILNIATNIKTTAEKIREKLDSNEKSILHQLSVVHSRYKANFENMVGELQAKKVEIKLIQKNIEEMREFASDYLIFLGSHKINSKLEKERNSLCRYFENDHKLRQKNVSLKFTPGQVLNQDRFLGTLEVEEVDCEIPFAKNASLETELPLDVFHDIDSIQIRTNSQSKIKEGSATRNLAGCTFLENDQMLLTDWSENKELLVFDEHGNILRNIVLDKRAFDVVYIGNGCIAMTFPDTKQVAVLNMKSKQEKIHVTFENRVWGITYSENKLFVREYSVGIHCLDLTGTIHKTIPVHGYITHITSLGRKLYYTEHTPDVVHCCDFNGTELWHLPLVGHGAPKGIAVGKYGFLFVVLENERKLLVVSPDGTHHRELLNEENGLHEPHAINYDMKRNKLLLVKDKTRMAEIYDVLY
ncbi:uncharacterized protein LOC127728770 [Mytilus californianus]|uniref:uncharacterized protein LOC127728770 n=1 Tax=Mytilus californianus TaxID=6549 RepID=UPI00224600AD|nr:uncharacterized protein LOC127728770 [Mytilus californianus]